MGAILQGEVSIDGRKAIVTLKNVQREATRTSQSFDRAGSSTSKLVASFLKANSAASVFGTSLRALGRFGGAGILGAGAATALNRFGEAVKRNATDYFQAQRSLASAFEVSFRSTSVEEARKGIEQTKDVIDELRGKVTQLGPLAGFLGGVEKFTGLNIFGVEDTKKAIEQANQQIAYQEEILELRLKEKKEIDAITKSTAGNVLRSRQFQETLKIEKDTIEGREVSIELAKEDLRQAIALRDENFKLLSILIANNREGINNEKIRDRNLESAKLELEVFRAQNNVIRANKKAGEEAARVSAERLKKGGEGAQFLLQDRSGGQALATARRRREIETTKENFKLREETLKELASQATAEEGQTVTKQDIRRRLAAQQVAQELPTMRQKLMAEEAGISPELLAAGEEAQRRGGRAVGPRESFKSVIDVLLDISKKLPSPPIPV